MADVKVNGNTYNGITHIQLVKAEGGAYEVYKEGAALIDVLLAGCNDSIGDIEIDTTELCLNWMQQIKGGTWSFPNATTAYGGPKHSKFDNLLMPNVTAINQNYGVTSMPYQITSTFNGTVVTGTLDLSSLATAQNNTVGFNGCTIGTLKLGSYCPVVNIWQGATITNLLFYNITADQITDNSFFRANPKVTNLYIPADCVDAVQALVDDGTITGVTNVYSIDDWSE